MDSQTLSVIVAVVVQSDADLTGRMSGYWGPTSGQAYNGNYTQAHYAYDLEGRAQYGASANVSTGRPSVQKLVVPRPFKSEPWRSKTLSSLFSLLPNPATASSLIHESSVLSSIPKCMYPLNNLQDMPKLSLRTIIE